jgi:tetratricopeptide (TPR) repeat protein
VTLATKEPPFLQQRLDAWKSIARHLGRTCRTVQRWHEEYGLPIHRLGGDKGPIYAYANELDEWMRNRGGLLMKDVPEISRPVLLHTPLAREESVRRNETFDASLIPGSGKGRSAELAALANRMWETLTRSKLDVIARLFREAIDLDPGNAEAFAGLANSLIAEGLLGIVSTSTAYTSAKAALQRALEIDPELAEARSAEAWLKMVATRDWEGARGGFDEALQRQPRSTRAMIGRALLHIAEECHQDASAYLIKARQQNPLSTFAVALCCWSQYLAGDHAKALDQVEQARATGQYGILLDAVQALACIQLEEARVHIQCIEALAADAPHQSELQGALGFAHGVAGHRQRASDILDAMMRLEAHEAMHDPYAIALVLIGLNQKQEAVKRLEQSYREGSLWSLGFQSDPILASLHSDPHYLQFMSKVNYPVPKEGCPCLEVVGGSPRLDRMSSPA